MDMSELREECDRCLNNQKCFGGAEYGSLYCMMNRRLKMQNEEDSVYAHKFATMQKELDKKDARIKELEEKNRVLCEEYYPRIAKIKDLIENETINISGFECIAVEDLEELLEESK